MDTWNPILAETHIKRVPIWQAALQYVAFVVGVLAATWLATAIVLSLVKP